MSQRWVTFERKCEEQTRTCSVVPPVSAAGYQLAVRLGFSLQEDEDILSA